MRTTRKWGALVVLAVALATTSAARSQSGQEPARTSTPVSAGPAAPIGGPFSLVDHKGKRVSDRDFRGRFLLIYYGYTYCPDLCPTGLQTIADTIDVMGAAGRRVQPIFISIDPERDRVEQLADYVAVFHRRLIGLTGTARQVAAAAKIHGVRYGKIFYPWSKSEDEPADGSQGPGADYAMYHTTSTFLVGPDGRRLAVFPRGTGPDAMAREIRRHIDAVGK